MAVRAAMRTPFVSVSNRIHWAEDNMPITIQQSEEVNHTFLTSIEPFTYSFKEIEINTLVYVADFGQARAEAKQKKRELRETSPPSIGFKSHPPHSDFRQNSHVF
jgi:hypothetical protein